MAPELPHHDSESELRTLSVSRDPVRTPGPFLRSYSSGYESLLIRFGSPLSATHHSKTHSATVDGRYYRVNIDVAHIDTPSV